MKGNVDDCNLNGNMSINVLWRSNSDEPADMRIQRVLQTKIASSLHNGSETLLKQPSWKQFS